MPDLVECCLANAPPGIRDALRDTTDATVRERPCLQRCGHCHRAPFLVVDGEFVHGDDHRSLLADTVGEP